MELTVDQENGFRNYPEIKEIIANDNLSKDQMIEEIEPYRKKMEKDIKSSKKELSVLECQRDFIEWLRKAESMMDIGSCLERNNCSRLHKLVDSMQRDEIVYMDKSDVVAYEEMAPFLGACHSFVVEHDWAQAFKDAHDYNGEVQTPYHISAFEFTIAGECIINFAVQNDECGREEIDAPYVLTPFVRINDTWICIGEESVKNKVFTMLYDQINAICVAMEAEIAVENLVRAPIKLNKKRKKKSEVELFDYHVVSLNKRYRSDVSYGGKHRSPRFHFRRGHWRHFQNHKTYVKWTLVGSPELGFIDKHYKL
jgi:hypothetical protein